MRINYITSSTPILASHRYQLLNPSKGLEQLGHTCTFSLDPLPDYDIYVFHKHFRLEEKEMIKRVKGKKVWITSDYHFNTPFQYHNIHMIKETDIVITPSSLLAYYIKEKTGKDVTVIYDSWDPDFQEKEPVFNPKGKLNCLWFGHPTNLDALNINLNKLIDCTLSIVTHSGISMDYISYSPENLSKEFEKCDVVIIPQSITDPRKHVKAHSRVVESLRAGKFVIAAEINSYKLFKDWIFLGDLKEGLDWLKVQKKEDIVNRIKEAHVFIRNTFEPKIIAKQWERVLSNM